MATRALAVTPQSFTTFGELLRYLRERAELSQRELALQVGYHYSYMSRIEKSERIPDSATLMARFVPALYLDEQPEWTARLLKLATESETKAPSLNALPIPVAPPTALPIFDLSASNLPTILTPLLGRDSEVIALSNLLIRDDVRLVTLVGPPGVGKTRLVTHIAAQMAGSFAAGAAFVDLTQVSEPKDFLPALAGALSMHEISEMPLMTHLVNALRQKNILLVIDNFEHVIDAAPQVLQLLSKAPRIKALITSREALRVSGENEFTVAPLPLPQKPTGQLMQDNQSQEDPMAFAAIQLFAQRARAVQPDFQLTSENMEAVLEVCRRLDGLPLAIELAAARVKILTPQAMLAQFDRYLDWLAHSTRDSSKTPRQTLRGAFEWSYNLLSEPECILMRRLSVFSGGWTSGSAEAICGDVEQEAKENPLLLRGEVLDLLIQLADKSLLITEKLEDETRFHFLETIRDFAREKLEQSDEYIEIKNRHLTYFAGFAEEVESHLDGMGQVIWCFRAEQEHNNLHAALDWGLREGASLRDGLRLAAAISLFWLERSYFHEGLEWLDAYLQRTGEAEHQLDRAKMLFRSAAIQARIFDYVNAYKLCQQSIAIARAFDEKRHLASALFYMGDIIRGIGDLKQARDTLEECVSICWSIPFPQQLNMALASLGRIMDIQGEHERARSILSEALAIAERIEDTWGLSYALLSLGTVNRYNKNYEEAIHYLELAREVSLKIGDRHAEGVILANLAILHNLKDDFIKSEQCAEQAFAVFQTIGDEVEQPFPLRTMGYAAIHAGNLVRARVLIQESLKGNRALEDIPGQLACVVAVARCCFAERDVKQAVSLCALIETRMNTDNVKLLEPDVKALQEVLTQGKQKLSKSAYETAYAAGKALQLEDEIMKLMVE